MHETDLFFSFSLSFLHAQGFIFSLELKQAIVSVCALHPCAVQSVHVWPACRAAQKKMSSKNLSVTSCFFMNTCLA